MKNHLKNIKNIVDVVMKSKERRIKMKDDNWDKFCKAKDELIDNLNIETANDLLKEAGTDLRLKRKNEIKRRKEH